MRSPAEKMEDRANKGLPDGLLSGGGFLSVFLSDQIPGKEQLPREKIYLGSWSIAVGKVWWPEWRRLWEREADEVILHHQ